MHGTRTAGVLRTPGLPIETCNFFYFVSMIPEYLMNRINGVMVHIRQRQPSVNGIRVIHRLHVIQECREIDQFQASAIDDFAMGFDPLDFAG